MLKSRPPLVRFAVLAAAGLAVLAALGAAAVVFGSPRAWLGLESDKASYRAAEPTSPCLPKPRELKLLNSPAPAAGHWTENPPLPFGRDEATSAFVDGRVYFIAGHTFFKDQKHTIQSVGQMVSFVPGKKGYREEPSLPIPIDHTSAVSYDGAIYVIGGFSNRVPIGRLFRFDPKERTWTELASMPKKRGAEAAAVVGDKLLVAGGAPPTFPASLVEPYHTLEIYDFASDTWTEGAPMPTARHHVGAAALDGKFYVAGGREPDDPDFSLNAFERYDPATDSWEKLPPIPQGVGGVGAVATDSEVVVLGGADEIERWITPTVWAFNPETESWRRLPDLEVARHSLTATVGAGRIWAMGGAPCPGFGLSNAVESLPLPRPGTPGEAAQTSSD